MTVMSIPFDSWVKHAIAYFVKKSKIIHFFWPIKTHNSE